MLSGKLQKSTAEIREQVRAWEQCAWDGCMVEVRYAPIGTHESASTIDVRVFYKDKVREDLRWRTVATLSPLHRFVDNSIDPCWMECWAANPDGGSCEEEMPTLVRLTIPQADYPSVFNWAGSER